jgi:sodium-dependent dicarboxylate transporter 2/3/5
VRDMVRSGIAIDLISIVVISLYLYFVLPLIWKIDLFHFPEAFLK